MSDKPIGFDKYVESSHSTTDSASLKMVWMRQQEEQDKKLGIVPEQFWVKTGYPLIDKSTNGLISGSLYIFGGLKKSGKSSYLMNVLNNMLLNGIKVGFLDTELRKRNFIRRFTAVSERLHEFDDAISDELTKSWEEIYLNSKQLQYAEDGDVSEDGILDAFKTTYLFENWRSGGTQVFVIDNITTLMTQTSGQNQGYQVLSNFMAKLSKYAKDSNIVLIIVLHTIDSKLIYKESAARIYQLLEGREPEKIFEKSITINTRPSSSDLYGGGGIRSQISGGVLLLWRPYQQLNDAKYKRLSMLILEDWRFELPDMQTEFKLDFNPKESRYREIPPVPKPMLEYKKPYKEDE